MLGELLERHRATAVLLLSGFILFGAGISLGFGLSQPSQGAGDIRYSGETLSPGEKLPSPVAEISFPININTADALKLEELPGIGPAKAEAIVASRKQNGIFKAKEELQNVSGIGPQTFAKLKSLITVK